MTQGRLRQKKRNEKIPPGANGSLANFSDLLVGVEKIDAILSLMEFSSRMKDYYDIYYLANKFDFDGKVLTEALKKTFENRGHTFTIEQFEQVMSFADDSAMQKKWKAFCRKIDTQTDDFSIVLRTIKVFLTKLFIAVLSKTEFSQQWIAAESQWKKGV